MPADLLSCTSVGSGAGSSIDEKFKALESGSDVDDELAAMKQSLVRARTPVGAGAPNQSDPSHGACNGIGMSSYGFGHEHVHVPGGPACVHNTCACAHTTPRRLWSQLPSAVDDELAEMKKMMDDDKK